MGDFSLEEGTYLVRLARKSIETYMIKGKLLEIESPPYTRLKKPSGTFVTLNSFPDGMLRGCIGYPEPILPLYQAVIRAAVAAAFEDPRFPPLSEDELDSIIVEVSILTPPKRIDDKIDRESLPKVIKIGEHGLVIKRGFYSGLLLPQVATEYSWNSTEFLNQTCLKAGLWKDCWLQEGTEVYIFSAEIFSEIRPKGEIVKKEI